MGHHFGGPWSRKKIEILKDYLFFYSNALKNQPFTLHYVDAFAGTGSHTPKKSNSNQISLIPLEEMKGSVKTALDIIPGFNHYHFNDLNPGHVKALEEIKKVHPNKSITISQMDANVFVPEFCATLGKVDRAVMFIDPYNTEFHWDTLKHIGRSKKIDMWLLFPISDALRLTPKKEAKIRPEWEKKLNQLLGTSDWQSALYKPVVKPPMDDLFSEDAEEDEIMERINPDEVKIWVKSRLEEVFSFVAEPFMLYNNGRPLFLFFFAVSNNSFPAQVLAKKVVKEFLTKKYSR